VLDIQFIRDNPDLVQEKSRQKGYEIDVKQLLELDAERRTRLTQIEELRRRRNELAAEMKNQKPSSEHIAAGRQLKEELATLDEDLKKIGDVVDQKINRALEPVKRTLDEHTDKLDALLADMSDAQDRLDSLWEKVSGESEQTKKDIQDIKTQIGLAP